MYHTILLLYFFGVAIFYSRKYPTPSKFILFSVVAIICAHWSRDRFPTEILFLSNSDVYTIFVVIALFFLSKCAITADRINQNLNKKKKIIKNIS